MKEKTEESRTTSETSDDSPESEGRVTQLLETATQVFLEMGYEAASTAEIASRAHTSKRAIYSQFSSKEDLFLAVIDYATAKIADRVTELFEMELPVRDLLLKVAAELLCSLLGDEHIALLRVVYAQAKQIPTAAQHMHEQGPERGIGKLGAHLKRQSRRGILAIPDADVAAQQFAGMLVGNSLHRAMLGQSVPRSRKQLQQRAEATVDAFLKIYPPAATNGKTSDQAIETRTI